MISAACLTFCHYLVVEEATIPSYIDNAVGSLVNRGSGRYDQAYTLILQWRKNWFYAFTHAVEQLQQRIEQGHKGLNQLSTLDLRDIYASHFGYESFYNLMGTTCAVVDCRATLDKPRSNNLYKTIFTYSLM